MFHEKKKIRVSSLLLNAPCWFVIDAYMLFGILDGNLNY